MSRIVRVCSKVFWRLLSSAICVIEFIDTRTYMKMYLWSLRQRGMRIEGSPRYISPKCWFDGVDFSLIEIGHDVVISFDVRVLTHDYSVTRALLAVGAHLTSEVSSVRPVKIGSNSFIGAGSILMPGTSIGPSCIVGAGSVVRGSIPANSIVVGNPAVVSGDTLAWGRKQLALLEDGKLRADPDWQGGLSDGQEE